MKLSIKTSKPFLLWLLCLALPNMAQAVIPTSERNALIALYEATSGDNWIKSNNWKTNSVFSAVGTECSWYGVTCNTGDLNVTELSLNFNRLVGDLPVELENLSSLKSLTLGGNQLTSIPTELGNLTSLTHLTLNRNQLTNIPAELGNSSSLTFLNLSDNQLFSIPTALGYMTNLTHLVLTNSQLMSIPAELEYLTNLTYLNLSNNQLKSIPAELGNIASLITLYLNNNQLTSIPMALGYLTNLNKLSLDGNQLKSIPPELGDLMSLTNLSLNNNQLTSIPARLGYSTNLRYISLNGNQLNSIPAELENLSNLTYLYLNNNQLTSIPAELGNLSNLTNLYLNNNQLTSIPAELGKPIMRYINGWWVNIKSLAYLDFHNNQLTSIPVELGNLANLQILGLKGNKLTGAIPSNFIKLTKLLPSGLNLKYNGLYSTDSSLLSFLNSKHYGGDIMTTQTLDADGVVVSEVTQTTADITWDPLSYTQAGGYRVYISTDGGVNYDLASDVTDKTITSLTLTGMCADNSYLVRLLSYTSPHANNRNEIESDGQWGNTVTIDPLPGGVCGPIVSGYGHEAPDGDNTGTPDGSNNSPPDGGNSNIPDGGNSDTPDNGSNETAKSSSKSAFGCSLHPGTAFDPLLPFMLLFAAIYLLNGYRHSSRRKV